MNDEALNYKLQKRDKRFGRDSVEKVEENVEAEEAPITLEANEEVNMEDSDEEEKDEEDNSEGVGGKVRSREESTEKEADDKEHAAKRIRLNMLSERRQRMARSINNVCKYANCKSMYSGICLGDPFVDLLQWSYKCLSKMGNQ